MKEAFLSACKDGDLQLYTLLIGTELYEYSGENPEELAGAVARRISTYGGALEVKFANGLRIIDGKITSAEQVDTTLFDQRLKSDLTQLLQGRAAVISAERLN